MPTIDERIVEMQFSNKQFEEGVATSIRSLERLKEALNLDETIDNLKEFENVTGQINLSNVDEAAQNINSTFTLLGKTIDTFRGNVAKKISGIAENIIGKAKDIALTGLGIKDMSAGFDKYAEKTKAVQTIMNATGESIEEVQAVLEDLMNYTDETSYDFTEMTKTIGKFVSSGVDLETSEKAMEGIGNAAALAGAGIQEANHAMYNLSQALAAGVVKNQDWNSIVNANMATKEFKEEIIKSAIELGVLQKQGEAVGTIVKTNETKLAAAERALAKAQSLTGKAAVDQEAKIADAYARIEAATKETTVNFQTFASTLTEDWLTSEVLLHALEKFSNRSTELGRRAYEAAQKALTFNDAIGAIKDAITSGWMQSFEYIFGDLEEAKDLWTDFCNNIIKFIGIFSTARNDILKNWHDLGGYNAMLEAAGNLWGIFMDSVYAARDALLSIFPGLENAGAYLANLSKNIRDVTARWRKLIGYEKKVEEEVEETNEEIKESAEDVDYTSGYLTDEEAQEIIKRHQAMAFEINGIYSNLKRGMRGNEVKALQEQLFKMGYLADKSMADGIYGPQTEAAIKKFQADLGIDQTGVYDNATKNAIVRTKSLVEAENQAAEAARKAAKVRIEMSEGEARAQEAAEDNVTTNTMRRIQNVVGGVFSLIKLIAIPLKLIEVSVTTTIKAFLPLGDAILTFFSFLGRAVTGFANAIDQSFIIDTFRRFKENQIKPFADAFQTLANFINDIFGKDREFHSFSEFWENFIDVVGKNNPVVIELVEAFQSFGTTIGSVVSKVVTFGSTILNWLGEKTVGAIKWLWEILPNVLLILVNSITSVVKAISHSAILKGIINGFLIAITAVASVVTKLGNAIQNFFKNNNGVASLSGLFTTLSKQAPKNKLLSSIVNLFNKIGKGIQKIKPYVRTFTKFIGTFISGGIAKAINWLQNGLPVVIDGFVDFATKTYDAAKNSETFQKVWSGFSTFFGGLATAIFSFASIISNAVKSLFINDDGSYANPFEKIKEKVNGAKESISSFAETVKSKFKEIYNNSDFIRNLYDNYLKPFWEKFSSLAAIIRDGIISFITADTSGISGIIPKLQKRLEGFDPLITWVNDRLGELTSSVNSFIQNFSFENVINGIIDTFNAIGSLGTAKAEAWDPIKGQFIEIEKDTSSGGIFDSVLNSFRRFGAGFDSVKNYLFEKLESNGFNTEDIFHYIKEGLGLFALIKVAFGISKIGKGFKNAGKGILKLGNSMGEAFTGLSETIHNFLTGQKGELTILDSIRAIISGYKEITEQDENERPKDSIGDTMLKIAGSLLIIAAAVALIANIKDPKQLLTGVGTLVGVVVVLSTAAGILGKHGASIDKLGNALLKFVASIGILAISLLMLNGVIATSKPEVLTKSLLIIGGMLVALGLIEALLLKLSSSDGDEDSEAKVSGIFSMCAGIFVLVSAIGKLAKLRKKYSAKEIDEAFDIIKSFITRFAILEIIIAAISRFGSVNAGSISVQMSGIQSMCIGIYLLAMAMGKVAKDMNSVKNYDKAFDIIKSFVTRLSILEIILAGISRIGKKKIGSIDINMAGIQSMCVGILLLTVAMERVAKGLTKVKGYEAAFDMVVSIVKTLGRIEIAIAAVNKGGAIKISGILAMCAGVGIIVFAIGGLADYYDYYANKTNNGQKINSIEIAFSMITSILRTLAITTGALSVAMAKLALIPTPAIFAAIANFALIAVGVTAIFTIIGIIIAVLNAITEGGFADAMANAGNTIGRIIGAFVTGFVQPFVHRDIENEKPKSFLEIVSDLAVGLNDAFDKMWPFLEKVKSVTREHRVGVGNFIVCILEMIGADFLDAITTFVSRINGDSGSGSAFVDFANNLVKLVDPLTTLGNTSSSIKVEGLTAMIPAMEAIGSIAKAITKIGWEELKQQVFSWISLDSQSGYFFIADLVAMVRPLRALSAGSRLFNADGIEKYIPAFEALGSVAKAITKIGWEEVKEQVFKVLSLGNNIKTFINDLVSVIPGLITLGATASLINADALVNVSTAIAALGEAAKVVPEAGGFIQDIVGSHDLKKFGGQLGTLGFGLMCFYMTTKSIPAGYDPSGAVTALTNIASVASVVPDVNGILQKLGGEKNLATFGGQLGELGKGLKEFYDYANKDKIPEDFSVDALTTALGKIADVESSLEKHGGSFQKFVGERDIGTFGEGIGKLGDNLLSFYNNISSVDAEKISLLSSSLQILAHDLSYVPDMDQINKSTHNLQLIMNTIANLDYTNFENTAKNIIKNINKGLTENEETPASSLSRVFADMYTVGAKFFDNFTNLGKYLDLGVAVGVIKNSDLVIKAIERVMQEGYASAAKTWESHSPSKKGIKLGKSWDQGVEKGLNDNSNAISGTMKKVMDNGYKKVNKYAAEKGEEAGKSFIDSLNDGMDNADIDDEEFLKKYVPDYEEYMNEMLEGNDPAKMIDEAMSSIYDGPDDESNPFESLWGWLDDTKEKVEETTGETKGFFGQLMDSASKFTRNLFFGENSEDKIDSVVEESSKAAEKLGKTYDATFKEIDILESNIEERNRAMEMFNRWNPDDGNIRIKDKDNTFLESIYDIYGNKFQKEYGKDGSLQQFDFILNKNRWGDGKSETAKRVKALMEEGEGYLDATAKAVDEELTKNNGWKYDAIGRPLGEYIVDAVGNPIELATEDVMKYIDEGYSAKDARVAAQKDYIEKIKARQQELIDGGLSFYEAYSQASAEVYEQALNKRYSSFEASRALLTEYYENLENGIIDIDTTDLSSIGGLSGLKKIIEIISDPTTSPDQYAEKFSYIAKCISDRVDEYVNFGFTLEDAYVQAEKDLFTGNFFRNVNASGFGNDKIIRPITDIAKSIIEEETNRVIDNLGGKKAIRDKVTAGGFEAAMVLDELQSGLKGIGKTDEEIQAITDSILNLGKITTKTSEPVKNEIKDTYTELEKLEKKMVELYAVGNVDLTKRPIVSPEKMRSSGWEDFDGDYATLFSSTYTAGKGGKEDGFDYEYDQNVIIDITPITKDGEVLSPQALEDYIWDLLASGKNIIEADSVGNGGLGLLLKVDPIVGTVPEAIEKSEEWTSGLHDLQEEYYGLLETSEKATDEAIEKLGGMDAIQEKIAEGGFTATEAIDDLKAALKEVGKTDSEIQEIIDKISSIGTTAEESSEIIEKSGKLQESLNTKKSKYTGTVISNDKKELSKQSNYELEQEPDVVSDFITNAMAPIENGLSTLKESAAGIAISAKEVAEEYKDPIMDIGSFLLKIAGFDRHGVIEGVRSGKIKVEGFDSEAFYQSITPFVEGTGKILDASAEQAKSAIKSVIGNAGDAADGIAHIMEGPISNVSSSVQDASSKAVDAGEALLIAFSKYKYNSDSPLSRIFTEAKAEISNTEDAANTVVGSMKANLELLSKELGITFNEVLIGAGNGLKERGIDLSNVSVTGLDAESIAESIASGIENNSNVPMSSAAKSLIKQIAQSMLDNNSEFLSIGSEAINSVDKGLADNGSKVSDTASSIMKDTKGRVMSENGISSSSSSIYHWIGQMMIDGLTNGLNEGSSRVTYVAQMVARRAYEAACRELGVNSPSEEFMWIGEMVCEGFSQGLTNYSSIVGYAASQMSENAIDSAMLGIQGVYDAANYQGPSMAPIRPVVEWNQNMAANNNNSETNSGNIDILTSINTSAELALGIASAMQVDVAAIKESVDKGNADIIAEFKSLNEHIDALDRDIMNTKIYLDSNAIVAGTVSKMDRALGQRYFNSGGRR